VVPSIGAKLQLAQLILLLYRSVCHVAAPLPAQNLVVIWSGLTIQPMAMLAALVSHSAPYVTLARKRIIDPLTVIRSAFGPAEAHRSWAGDPEKLFTVANEEDRLNVGPKLISEGKVAFGVSRRQPV
jgi:hypothetical protein